MFAHLHNHSEYSLLDGLGRIPDLLQRAKELGMGAVALTDHGALYGAVHFYQAAREMGIKPILGVEAYVAPGSRHSRTPGDKQPYHLVLLARNEEGYHNLIWLVTRAHLEGFYYKPRMDRELLEEHRGGLIALSGCPTAEVPRLLLAGRWDEAREAVRWHKETFDGYFLEVQRHEKVPDLPRLNEALVALGREMEVPLVATNDIHYVHREDAPTQDILLCIQTNATVQEQNRMRLDDDSFYLKSEEEMRALFADLPEAVDNTWRVAEMCDLRLEFNRLHLPQIEAPPAMSSFQYLSMLCREGFERRYGAARADARARLDYELDVVRQMEFADYFLVVWDIVSFARREGILVGVRGSAAASAILYCLEITDIDPLAYGLVFERFLNLERKEMPDIDLDFQDERRGEVLDYVTRRFGRDHVAQIITFGTLGAKAAIRDVGRALAMSYAEADRVARLIPGSAHPMPLDQALDQVPQLREAYQQDAQVRTLVDTARRLEGVARHASTHAAGVVISREPLVNVVPLQRPARGADEATPMTQWDMDSVAKVGLLKMDLLGLINLTTLARTRDLVAQVRGERIDLQRIPLDDAATFDLLSRGETTGLFQLEGAGMRRSIKQLKPRSLAEISAMIALYRPGPMEHIPRYIEAKFGRAPVAYPHPDLAELLAETYGVIVYQDQVLQIARRFAGYSLGEADVVRKAMGKKVPAIMAQERARFIQGAVRRHYAEEQARAIFDLIEPFAGYAFNKAHSISYAFIAYQTAYLKAHYPVEYMTSLFNCHLGQQERAGALADECQVALGIPVLPPDVNASDVDFAIEGDPRAAGATIRTGLGAVKNVGRGAVESIVAERRARGPFGSLEDFVRRTDLRSLNRRALESLIKAGALDGLGPRGALLEGAERILSLAQREHKIRESRQSTMFGALGALAGIPLPALALPASDVPSAEKGAWEKELTGIYFTEDPYRALRQAAGRGTVPCGDVGPEMAGQRVTVAGRVSSVRNLTTKQGEAFLSAVLDDGSGSVEVTVWPNTYRDTQALWSPGAALRVQGRVRLREDRVSLACDRADALDLEAPDAEAATLEAPEPEAASPEAPASSGPAPIVAEAPPPDHPEDTGHPASDSSPAPQRSEGPPASLARASEGTAPPGTRSTAAAPQARAGGPDGRARVPRRKPAGEARASGNGHEKRYQLTLRLRETEDEAEDLGRLQQLLAALEAHPGRDPVRLLVQREGETDVLTLPQEASYGPELAARLADILGEGALGVQEFLA